MNRADRVSALMDALNERILVLDGAMGTAIQALNLPAKDFGGDDLDGCNENLNLTRPDAVEAIHDGYLKVGADIIETNTFGGTPLVLKEYDLEAKAVEINRAAAEIARRSADRFWTPSRPRFVAGSMGPTTKAITVTGGVTFPELIDHYYAQAKGLHAGGADYFLVETCQDTRNVKTALLAIERLFEEGAERIPVAVSGTIEASGTMLAGQSVEALWASLAHQNLLYIGLNCATGPEFMTDHLRSLSALARTPVACVPNAGLPDADGHYLETPDMMEKTVERFAQEGWVNVLGGCCGTTPPHIERLVKIAQRHPRRKPSLRTFSFLSGIDFLEVTDDLRPLLVGERSNVIGSRKFKGLIAEGNFEAAAEVARGQIRSGAQIVDICLADPDRDEQADMEQFLNRAIKMLRAPLMIDSTDDKVMEMALPYSQGKAILNSINLEDGEKRFEKVVPLAKRYGAALVVGLIDDDPKQGMAISRQRKLDVARRSYRLLTDKYGMEPEDIYWDALVFPCGTGDAQYVGSALETVEGVRHLKKEFPQTRTILGISNVSFGLPPAGREVLNSVFLYHCVQAGLDLAIVNTQALHRYPSIPENERGLAENLLFNRGSDPVGAFAGYFRSQRAQKKPRETLPLDERLARCIVEGSKEGLTDDLDLALKNAKPLDIINGPLMKGMDEVGRLFNANELIVAEVLQSAEAMKAAVSHLEPFMEKTASSLRGKVVLATVKGDVHDIGKNLVDIILSNNGFEVVNLGIKIPPEQLIEAVKKHSPQILGLSGLLVKSAQQMVATAEDLTKAGIRLPMLVGGAALTRTFTDRKIAKAYGGTVAYASDAMNGLELAKIIVDPKAFDGFKKELERRQREIESAPAKEQPSPENARRSDVQPVNPPSPPDFDRHVLTNTPLDQIWNFINPRMLLGRHLGVPNTQIHLLEQGKAEKKWTDLVEVVDEVKSWSKRHELLQPRAVYRFYTAHSEGDSIRIGSTELPFPRQKVPPYLCLADYVSPKGRSAEENLALFVVTAGRGVREQAEEWKKAGAYLKSHVLSALALETAEAYAEWLHTQLRRMWGHGDPPSMTMMERFQARYHGKRYSYGYPACPDLEGQRALFDLLKPEELGVTLTEGFMMDPEASVSAIVIHHPQATYYSV